MNIIFLYHTREVRFCSLTRLEISVQMNAVNYALKRVIMFKISSEKIRTKKLLHHICIVTCIVVTDVLYGIGNKRKL